MPDVLRKFPPVSPTYALFDAQVARAMRRVHDHLARGRAGARRVRGFERLLAQVRARVISHPVIVANRYLQRFSQGVTLEQARHELQQFSVFALQFDVAQCRLVANAPTKDAYERRLKLLLNEKGIPYKNGFDGELTGRWSARTVHFSWLEKTALGLGLRFEDIGKLQLAHAGTRRFVEVTFDTYAHLDANIALGAAFGIENWAANALWDPWIAGMRKLNETLTPPAHLGYLTYHQAEERHHSQSTLEELLEAFLQPGFDAEKFLQGALAALTRGVQAYYEGQLRTLPGRDASWPRRAIGWSKR